MWFGGSGLTWLVQSCHRLDLVISSLSRNFSWEPNRPFGWKPNISKSPSTKSSRLEPSTCSLQWIGWLRTNAGNLEANGPAPGRLPTDNKFTVCTQSALLQYPCTIFHFLPFFFLLFCVLENLLQHLQWGSQDTQGKADFGPLFSFQASSWLLPPVDENLSDLASQGLKPTGLIVPSSVCSHSYNCTLDVITYTAV